MKGDPFAVVELPGLDAASAVVHQRAGLRMRAAAPVAAPAWFLRRYLTDFELEIGQVGGVWVRFPPSALN